MAKGLLCNDMTHRKRATREGNGSFIYPPGPSHRAHSGGVIALRGGQSKVHRAIFSTTRLTSLYEGNAFERTRYGDLGHRSLAVKVTTPGAIVVGANACVDGSAELALSRLKSAPGYAPVR